MKTEQLCVDTMCYTAFPLDRALGAIVEAGIRRVELCASVGYCDHAAPERLGPGGSSKLLKLLEREGLTAVSLSAHADVTTDAGLMAFRTRLQLAAEMNIPVIITMPPERSGPQTEQRFYRTILELGDRAAMLGIVLCLETVGLHMRTAHESVALLQRLQHPNLRINYDPAAHLYHFGADLPSKGDVAVLGKHLGHVHLNDKATLVKGRWDFRPIGEGIVDWEPILDELDRVGFAGPASIEIGWESTPESISLVNDAVRRACQFVRAAAQTEPRD